MTTAPKKPKTKRQDAYIARVTISIVIDPADANSYGAAVIALDKLESLLPAGTVVAFSSRSLGKL